MTMKILSTLASRAKHGYAKAEQGRAGWLQGTFELAAALSEARKRLPADTEFSKWLVQHKLTNKVRGRATPLSNDDRAALIVIGQNVKAARKDFKANDDSWSWRLVAGRIRATSQSANSPPTIYQTVCTVAQKTVFVDPVYVKPPRPQR